MMTYEQFEKAVITLDEYANYETSLGNLGINIWERDEVANLVSNYVDMIALSLGLYVDGSTYSNDFDYWYYELERGHRVDEYFTKDAKEYEGLGTNLEKVYNFLIAQVN